MLTASLSATPKRDKTKGATGGMLAQIGSRGILVRLSEQGRKWAKHIGWLIEEEIGGDAA